MQQRVAVYFFPGPTPEYCGQKGIIRYYLLICASVAVYTGTCGATAFAYRLTIPRNYGTDAVLYSFGPCYHISAQSYRAGGFTSNRLVVSFRGHYDFTTRLRTGRAGAKPQGWPWARYEISAGY